MKFNLSQTATILFLTLNFACGTSNNPPGIGNPNTLPQVPSGSNVGAPGIAATPTPVPSSNPTEPEPTPSPSNTPTPFPTSSLAEGWKTLTVQAWSAKTILDAFAHFSTTRNACGRDADGVLSLEDWNSISVHLNQAVQKELTQEASYCVPTPEAYPYMDDRVEVEIDLPTFRGKKPLYEVKEGQICSTISDHTVSDALLNDINKFIKTADKQDVDRALCPWVQP